jgi:class 3 adenylate cyclase
MARLKTGKRARLPDSAFAYVDARGRRRLPVHDKAHVRNALARFNQVAFETDAARERARKRLLNAAKKYRIVPVGFITGELRSERRHAAAGRLVIELGRNPAPGELEKRLRTVLRDPTLAVLHWSDVSGAYLDGTGKAVPLPAQGEQRRVTYLERQGRPMTALVHDPTILDDPALTETVLDAVRFVVEKDRLHGQIQATSTAAAALPTGFVTLLMTDIEASTVLLRKLGDRYGALLNDVRGILRAAVSRASGREIDARADEFFAVFERATAAAEAAVAIQRELGSRTWTDDLADSRGAPRLRRGASERRGVWGAISGPPTSTDGLEVRVRVGIHSGRPTLTDLGYIGLAVHTTARVCSAAHGGQIVVSAATRVAIGAAAPTGIRFRSLGRHRLPGLPDAERLFQVQAQGLRLKFPRPRTGRRPPDDRRARPENRIRAGEGQLELPEPPV